MMSEEIKNILAKGSDMTEEDKKTVMEAIEAFKKAIEDACREHGFAYKAILSVTQEGIVPVLDIVQIKEEVTA